jgi:hypothetical protein
MTKGCWVLSKAFSTSNKMIMFFFFFLSLGCFYGGLQLLILYIEPSLHFWDETYLIMMDNLFDVFLDLVFKYFIEYFCICVHKINQSVIVFLCCLYVI